MNELKPVEQFLLPVEQQPKKVVDPRQGWTSASNADADLRCSDRHLAQKGQPELVREEGWDEFGNLVHAALATRKPGSLSERAMQVYEMCLEIEERVILQFFGEEEKNDLMTKAHERFWVSVPDLNHPGKKFKHSGEVDRVYRSKTKALVIDYKTLLGDIPSSSANQQLRDLVVLVNGNLMVGHIGAVLIQPLVTTQPEICLYTAPDIKQAAKEMFDRIRNSHKGGKRTPGKIQCTYCKAQVTCREYQEFATASLPEMREFIENPVQAWTDEQCASFLDRLPVAEKWLECIKAAIRRRVEKGELKGYEIGKGDRKFEVTDMLELAKRCEALGIPNVELFGVCTPGKAELTRLIRNKLSLKGKGLNAKVDELFAGIVTDERKKGSIEKVGS